MAEVREGYKMTELGEIPVDWEVKSIDEIFDIASGMSLSRAKTGSGDSYYLHYGDIHKNKKSLFDTSVDFEWLPKIDSSEIKIKSDAILKSGDVVFADASEDYADIGKNIVVKVGPNDRFVAGLHTIYIREKKDPLDLKYKVYAFKIDAVRKQIKVLATGTTVLGISKTNIGKLKLLIPSYKEQQKIAEILSSVDAQIEHSEQLIQKTKELKKGLMQQLLTQGIGHTEFKQTVLGELPIEWEVKALGEIYNSLKTGATPYRGKKEYYNGDIPWLSSGELKSKYIYKTNEHITREAVKETNLTLYPKGTFFIAITGLEAAGTRGSCGIITIPSTTNQSCLAFLPNELMDNEYLYYWYSYWGEWIAFNYAQGTKQQSLNLKLVETLKIAYPPLQEQKKIVEILSIVDVQIESYENEKVKYEEAKKGLMQQLLTGKVRVKVD